MPLIYKHDYHPLSIYGNIVSLLREHVSCSGLHLDIGCGYGAIAEPIRDELGLTYIGFDLADDGMASLRERGFETHRVDLADIAGCETAVARAIGNRPIASLSFMDTLEHLTNGEEVLAALRRLAAPASAPLALSVPNVAHKDLALKLLLGRWDVTEDGLLDHTHVTLYNHSRLTQLMKSVGWRKIATRDWPLSYSDQYFPASSPVLNEASPVGQFLQRLINRANPHAVVNQFVGIYRPDEPQPRPLLDDRVEPNALFLSVVITVTKPDARLRKLLRELTTQTLHDFELVLIHSSANPEEEIQTGLLQRLPILQGRARLVDGSGLSRAEALNAALERCGGRYFAVLDDAEGLDPAWIATLVSLGGQMPGAVLQVEHSPPDPSKPAQTGGQSDAADLALLPAFYRFARREHGCFATLAIPTSAFHQLGFRFELELPDGRGWDLALDAILHCGLNVSTTPAIAPLADSDLPPLTVDLLGTENTSLLKKLNDHPILLPIGAAERVEELARQVANLIDDAHKRTREIAELQQYGRDPEGEFARLQHHARDLEGEFARLQSYARDLEGEPDKLIQNVADRVKDRPVLSGLFDAFWPRWTASETPAEHDAPFLSVITRTQGKRTFTLRDTLMSLAGQSSQDFELVLVAHRESETVNSAVRDIVSEFPPSFQARTTVVTCNRLGRSSPLNDGIAHAKGRYVAVLDDDDIALGHWVETFERLAADAPNGALLRATCARQDFELTNSGDVPWVPRAASWFKVEWPSSYDAVSHLYANATPPMCVAYPIAVFRDDRLRFDEALNTVEDWDLMTRAAILRGVATTPEVTAIYRWGAASDVSTNIHSSEEWRADEATVRGKLDANPILLPAGSASRIAGLIGDAHQRTAEIERLRQYARDLEGHLGELNKRIHHLADQVIEFGGSVPWIDDDAHLTHKARDVLVRHLTSGSWRLTRPLRGAMRLFGKGRGGDLTVDTIPDFGAERLHLVRQIRRSTSWKITIPVRVSARLARRVKAKLFR